MNKDSYNFIKSHMLVNRIYDMIVYYGILKDLNDEKVVKRYLKKRLIDIEYVESLAKYFEEKLKYCRKNNDLKCNLIDLIYDLNYLKQYLS